MYQSMISLTIITVVLANGTIKAKVKSSLERQIIPQVKSPTNKYMIEGNSKVSEFKKSTGYIGVEIVK